MSTVSFAVTFKGALSLRPILFQELDYAQVAHQLFADAAHPAIYWDLHAHIAQKVVPHEF